MNSLAFDIGAHHGNKTVHMLSQYGKVVAVEPHVPNFINLKSRFAGDLRVVPILAAVSEFSGLATLHVCAGQTTLHTLSEKFTKTGLFSDRGYKWPTQEVVAGITLRNLIQYFGPPDYCKIDVEGFEDGVLRGLDRPIPLIRFEFHRTDWAKLESCVERLSYLGTYEYSFSLGESELLQCHFGAWEHLANCIRTCSKVNLEQEWDVWGDIHARLIL